MDMHDSPKPRYLDQGRAWTSTAGEGPRLHGRRIDGPGPRLHFLHGNGFCGGVYWPFLRGLAQDHALFCHDLEGHGASEPPERFSGVGALVARIPQVIAEQQLQDRPLVGIGHSFGAALTLAVAAANPGLFRALVLMDPIVMPPWIWGGVRLAARLGRNPISQAARRRRSRWASAEEVAARLRGRGIYQGWTEEALACFVAHATRDDADGSRVLCCPTSLEAAIFDHPVWPWGAFRRLQVPTLFLYGDRSYPFFPAAARRAAGYPPVTVQRIAGGHCFMLEDPAASEAAVRTFLAKQGL